MPLIRLPWRGSAALAPLSPPGSAEIRGANPFQIRMTRQLVPRLCFLILRRGQLLVSVFERIHGRPFAAPV